MSYTDMVSLGVRGPTGLVRVAAALAFPQVCPLCVIRPAGRASICDVCEAGLEHLTEPRCPACGGSVDGILDMCSECLRLEGRPWQHAVSAFPFAGRIRRAIHRLKYRRQACLAPWLGNCMSRNWKNYGDGTPDVVVPIPLHWWRHYLRGYNQAELLGRCVADALGIPLVRGLKRRTRTAQQATLDAKARRRNLRGAFAVRRPAKVENRHVLLVDDVLTTGTTLADATRALINAKTATVSVITAARG